MGGRLKPPEEKPGVERRAAARALYESTVGINCDEVGKEVGVDPRTVRRWKLEDGWRQAIKPLGDMSERATALADQFKTKLEETGVALDDGTPAAAEAVREFSTEVSVEIRAGVIDRHRKEWAAPRKIAYEAIQQAGKGDVLGAFERAKLAKITSETLSLIQAGECRAFGIKHDDKSGSTVVVLERGGSGDDGSGEGS